MIKNKLMFAVQSRLYIVSINFRNRVILITNTSKLCLEMYKRNNN